MTVESGLPAVLRRARQPLQSPVEGVRHTQGMDLRQIRPLAREHPVDRLEPQQQPALEMPLPQPHAFIQRRVRREGAA